MSELGLAGEKIIANYFSEQGQKVKHSVDKFDREEDMLNTFFDVIQDADILTGWNSEGFDIPYTVMRTMRIMSKDDTRKLCLW